MAEVIATFFDDLHRPVEVATGDRKGQVCRLAIIGYILDDHININTGFGQGAKNSGRHAGFVGNLDQGDFCFITAVGYSTD